MLCLLDSNHEGSSFGTCFELVINELRRWQGLLLLPAMCQTFCTVSKILNYFNSLFVMFLCIQCIMILNQSN